VAGLEHDKTSDLLERLEEFLEETDIEEDTKTLDTRQSPSNECGPLTLRSRGNRWKEVTSKYFPNNYANNLDCLYNLRTQGNQYIELQIVSLDLEAQDDCGFDSLTVRDAINDVEMAKFCGSSCSGSSIIIHSKSASVRFKTDGSQTAAGFKLRYRRISRQTTLAEGVTCSCDGSSDGCHDLRYSDYSEYSSSSDISGSDYVPECGGEVSGDSGSITSPNYPQSYASNEMCVWTITVQTGKLIQLSSIAINLEESNTCAYDYVEVDFGNGTAPKYCTNFPTQLSASNRVVITFRSDSSVEAGGFELTYSEVDITSPSTTLPPGSCGGLLQGLSGDFLSPGYPGNYENDMECEWIIEVPAGMIIRLEATSFALESHGYCVYDAVKVDFQDGSTPEKYCGTTFDLVESTGNRMTVTFTSDSSQTASGFNFQFTAVGVSTTPLPPGSCGGFLQGQSGAFSSPGFPSNYEDNMECIWTIEVPEGMVIRLGSTGSIFDIEDHSSCAYDALIIDFQDGSEPLKYCGSSFSPLQSTGSTMMITFVTDGSQTASGFNFQFTAVGVSTTPLPPGSCGGFLQGQSGAFSSPGFPSNYEDNMECTWTIEVPEGMVVRLSQTPGSVFSVERGSNCGYDAIEIDMRDGSTTRKFCGDSFISLDTTGNSVYVVFRTDGSVTLPGFSLTYTAVTGGGGGEGPDPGSCGGSLSGDSGVVTSPGYPNSAYGDNLLCVWTITVPTGQVVSLSQTPGSEFAVESHVSCDYDAISVGSGAEAQKQCGQKFCTVKSDSNTMTVTFSTDGSENGPGFSLTYTAVPSSTTDPGSGNCGGSLTSTTGDIYSPGYPNNNYDDNLQCVWTITVPEGKVLQIEQTVGSQFDIEAGESCGMDELSFDYGDGVARKQCGDTFMPIQSPRNTITVTFSTDCSISGRGFSLSYTAITPPPTTPAPTPPTPDDTTCGMAPGFTGNQAFIVGGQNAGENQYPYQIGLLRNEGQICGGTIVAPNWVVTASHCVEGNENSPGVFKIQAGAYNVQAAGENRQVLNVVEVIMHEDYNSPTQINNDIALLRLDGNLEYNNRVQPVCLPEVGSENPVGAHCIISGWGNTESSSNPGNIMQAAMVPILPMDQCRTFYSSSGITDNMFCAGYAAGGVDTCQGDSGGPLACQTGGQFILYGVTSWGHGCADAGKPGVYATVANLREWISTNTNNAV